MAIQLLEDNNGNPIPNVLDPYGQDGAIAAAQRSSQGYNPTTPVTPNWGYLGGGVDINKLNDPTHNTPKYEVQRVLAQWNPTQLGKPGLLALTPEQRRQLEALGYQIRDEDKIFRQDIGEIDVLHGDRLEYGWRPTGVGNVAPLTGANKPRKPTASTTTAGGARATTQPLGLPNTGRTGTGTVPTMNPNAQGSPQIFSDPATQILERVVKFLIDQRMAPLQNPELDRYQNDATQQMAQLRAPVYSETEEHALRAKSFEQLERDRAVAKQQAVERLAAMGHGRESGTYEEAIQLIDRRFDQIRAQRENELLTGTIDERQRRLTQALNISNQTATATTNEQNRQEGRQATALGYSAILPDIAERRLAAAQNAVNGQQTAIGSTMAAITQLLNQNQTQQGNQAAVWQGVIDMINNALYPPKKN